MRYAFTALSIFFFSITVFAQQAPKNTTNLIDPWYFGLEFEPVIGETVPGYHSFAFATYGSKWLIIGGRTNGLHGLNSNSNFETEYANNNIIVIDTTDWQWSTASLNPLPMNFADPLRSTNMQYIQKNDTLFMVGGYGWDSTNYMFTTFPYLIAIPVPQMINAVESGDSIKPLIRMYLDSSMAVAGGEMEYMDGHYYIVGGHKFEGRYSDQNNGLFTQTYTNSIRQFDIYNDIVFAPINNTELVDTNNLHRRDLNVVRMAFNDTAHLVILGGVFRKDKALPFTKPLVYNGLSLDTIVYGDQQYNQYTSAHFVIQQDENNAGVVLLGGMGTHNHQFQYDSLVPFVKSIVTERFYYSTNFNDYNQIGEYYVPDTMPGFLGTNAIFVPGTVLPTDSLGAYNLYDLPVMEYEPRKFAGYLFGGIRGTAPNNAVSSANDTIYRVYFKGKNTLGVEEIPNALTLKNLYPNPAGNATTLQMDLKKPQTVGITVYGIDGKLQTTAYTGNLGSGSQTITLNTGNLAAGMYILKIETPYGTLTKRLAVAR